MVYNISFNHPESSSGGIEGDYMRFTLGDHLCRCNLVLSTGLKVLIGHRKEIWKLIFRVLALHQSESRIMGCVWFIYAKMDLRYWLVPGNVKNNGIN